jgi:hypothetical protein
VPKVPSPAVELDSEFFRNTHGSHSLCLYRLSLLAYNLGNLWRRLALPREIGNWSLTSLQQAAGQDRRPSD